MPKPTQLPNMPPPAPGAPTLQYGYPQLGDRGKQIGSEFDSESTSTGTADTLKYINPFYWFGKSVTYSTETRWFNTYRAERRPQDDHYSEVATPLGEFVTRRRGNVCWMEQKYRVKKYVENAYEELQRYEVWLINQTQESYYEFFTGFGGTSVDFAIDGTAVGSAVASQSLSASAANAAAYQSASAAAATGDFAAMFGTAGTPAASAATFSRAAAITGGAARFMGALGWGYLVFQLSTGFAVWMSGGARNLAGDLLNEGWASLRTFWDERIELEEVEEWRPAGDPHPCTAEEMQNALLMPGQQAGRFSKRQLVALALVPLVGLLLLGTLPFLTPDARQPAPPAADSQGAGQVGVVGGAPANDGAPAGQQAAANRPPMVEVITVSLATPVTTYAIGAFDPDGDALTYEWRLAGEACGTPRGPWMQSGVSVRWSHDSAAPDSCLHTTPDHPVTVTVTVIEAGQPRLTCTVRGSASQTLDASACAPAR